MAASIIDFNLDHSTVEAIATSVLKEYLARKGFKDTLKKFDEESPRNDKSLNSRSKIVDFLKLNKLYESNKTLSEPYSTVLELLTSFLLNNELVTSSQANIKTSISNSDLKQKQASTNSKISDDKMGNRQFTIQNDLVVDDADEENDLRTGSEKRVQATSKNSEDAKLSNTKKSASTDKAPTRKEPKILEKNTDSQILTSKVRNSSSSSLKNQIDDSDSKLTTKTTSSSVKLNSDTNSKIEPKATSLIDTNTDDDFDMLLKAKSKEIQNKKQGEAQSEKTSLSPPLTTKSDSKTSGNIKQSSNESLPKPAIIKAPNNIISSSVKKEYNTTPMDLQTAINLKTLIFGSANIPFNDEWKYQSFKFCDFAGLKYGLIQKKGGPCGVMATVQAYFILELFFLNESTTNEKIANFDVNRKDRSRILSQAIAKLLWKCGEEHNEAVVCVPTMNAHFAPIGKYRSDGITETINMLTFDNYKNLENFILKNNTVFENEDASGCILLLYSAIFSRQIKNVQSDMDEPTNKIMGQHGYCTQEMVNLLLCGKAFSNVFNDQVYLDALKLKGPEKRNDIGFLSLFEHYKSCEVGSYLKTPKYPVWVVCSESHFSVMFSLKKDILSDWKAESKFDLYYYDGLARQDEQIKLTITSPVNNLFSKPRTFKSDDDDKDLIPPLELVIRTKWKDANIDWNGYEPIL